MQNLVQPFKKWVIYAVMIMIAVAILVILANLVINIYELLFDPNYIIVSNSEILQFLGSFLLVVIGIELLDVVHSYLGVHKVHVEVVLLVAVTAVAREFIVFDYEKGNFALLAATGVAVLALTISYYYIFRTFQAKAKQDQ